MARKSRILGSPLRILLFAFGFAVAGLAAWGADRAAIRPYERPGDFKPANSIDTHVLAKLGEEGMAPTLTCSDEVFVRRVYLDVIGTLPSPWQVQGFLKNKKPDKRAALIDKLLDQEEFADYWSLKWCDLLRVKAEYPIKLWPNAVQAYHRWIRQAIEDNMPYDQFARELLTSSGSNFRVPQVNFYRAMQDQQPATIASAAALTFMGARFDKWPEKRREGMAALFSRVAFKGTAEWKEEIIHLDPGASGTLKAVFPDGQKVKIPADADPRVVFADWLITSENPWFARNIVNRVWSWLMGRGIIHEPDDIRPDNPAVNPALLACLEEELVKSGYDLKHIYRMILNSSTYQQSSIPWEENPKAEELFACYPVRRLEAETLIDAVCDITGTEEKYASPIPEPFTFIPEEHRSIMLADGSISDQFLEMFGRPARDTGLESERSNAITDSQRLHLFNSTHIHDKIDKGPRLTMLINSAKNNRGKIITLLYMTILSRPPTKDETAAAKKYFQTSKQNTRNGARDLSWALINSKEFLYRH